MRELTPLIDRARALAGEREQALMQARLDQLEAGLSSFPNGGDA